MRLNASRCAALAVSDFVKTFIPADTLVAQARTSWPSISTMHVSHVWIGPS